tara:strand:- start:188 stop:481 length:294 start_codon:yes stop_codon:yes gene_type:complete
MPNFGRLYKPAIETAAHGALKHALIDYFKFHERVLNNQSANSAKIARKKLQKVITMAKKRRLELLDLYSSYANNDNKQCFSTFSKSNTKEEKDNANQ